MKVNMINPVYGNVSVLESNSAKQKKHKKVSNTTFKSYDYNKSIEIARNLELKYGIKCDFDGNGYLAECVEKITNVFNDLFTKNKLPSTVSYKRLEYESAQACYNNRTDEVTFSNKYNYSWYYDLDSQKEAMKKEQHILLPDWSSSRHPGHVYAHEYSHCVHWKHLLERNGYSDAIKVWQGLVGTRVPTAIGRLITRYKISNYAVGSRHNCDMCEFLAERIAKDVCNGLTDTYWLKYKDIDVNYDNIFNRKWNYRYSDAQSYIDYFTQQVWNGDIEGAKEVGKEADLYLQRLDAQPVANTTVLVQTKTKKTIFEKIGNLLYNANVKLTEHLDNRNDLKINY